MRRCLPLLCCYLLFASVVFAQVTPANPVENAPAVETKTSQGELPKLEKFNPSLIDETKDPCVDFYQYSCTKWIAAHPIPSDMPSMSTSHPLYLYNQMILRAALEKAAADKQATGSQRQIGDWWTSCMDLSVRNADGKKWIQPTLDRIAALKSKQDLAGVVAFLHLNYQGEWNMSTADDNYARQALFAFASGQDLENASMQVPFVDQGGMALPALDYYLKDDAHYQDLRTKYVAYVRKMLEMIGEPSDKAAADAKTVLEIETAFAKASMDNVTRRDPKAIYNKRTLQEIKTAAPDFNWDAYLSAISAPAAPFYVVTQPRFLDALEQQIKTRSLEDWQAYLRSWAVNRSAAFMSYDFEQVSFDFFATTLFGVPQMLPQWRRCVQRADHWLGEALGEAYVDIAFPPESKARSNEMVHQIRDALDAEIQTLDWMSDSTKKQALVKQHATIQKIGYPDQWRNYSSVTVVPNNYLANMNSAAEFEAHRQINKIGKPVDRMEWTMTPATINAYEDSQMNTINFPAGILQMPNFGATQDEPSSYGAIGMVMGHEVIHGFDDQGRKFDAQGNLHDWWTPEDAKRYDEKDKCIVDQYSQEVPEYGVKQNGRLTAGEDTADNGGIHLAMMALEKKYQEQGKSLDTPEADGLTARQRFFLNYAFSRCSLDRPEAARTQIVADPHSLNMLRVNRPLSNLPEFQQAFGCKAGQPMVHAPACRVW